MEENLTQWLSGPFIPHGHCYLWKTPLVALHVISDGLIALAYFSIPLLLIYFVWKRKDLSFGGILLLFGAFIISCGLTHLMSIWTLWHPDYWVSGTIKASCALISVYTAFEMVPFIPRAIAFTSPEELEAVNQTLQQQIQERKNAEEKIEAERQRLFSLLDALPAFISLQAPDYSVRFLNKTAREEFGESADTPDGTLRDRKCHEVLAASPQPCPECQTFEVFKTQQPAVWQWENPKNRRTYDIYAYPFTDIDGQQLVIEMGIDVSDRIAAETQRREALLEVERSQRLLRTVIDTTPDLIFVKDRNFRYLLANQSFATALNTTPEEMVGKDDLEVGFPKPLIFGDPEQEIVGFRPDDETVLRQGQSLRNSDDYATFADGSEHIFDTQKLPLRDENGDIFAVLGFSRDVTAAKAAEKNLKEERQRLFSILDGIPAFLYLQAPDYSVRFANRQFREQFGEAGDRPCYEVVADRDQPCETCPTFRVFETQQSQNWEWHDERSGKTHQIYDYPFTDTDGTLLVVEMGIDISDRKQAEENLEKIAAERKAEAESLTEQVLKLLGEIKGAAQGDLTVKAEVTNDVLGAVADSFNYLVSELRKVVNGIQQLAQQVTQTAGESIASTDELARRARTQAQQLEEALRKVERMVNSIKDVSDAAQRAEQVARESAQTAEAGGVAVDRAVEGIDELRRTIADTAKMMKRLGESSQQIGKIVTSISQIAAQTNLLALNATIEAARAGEQGLGFAVVAEEVRKLAERSSGATEEISEIVGTIQTEIGRVMQAMETGTQEVVEGTELAAQAKTHLVDIIRVSREMNALIENITRASNKQVAFAEEISSTMTEVNQIADTTAHNAEDVTTTLNGLSVAVGKLQKSVAKFQS
ncbi:methyl-accepting chemotaxis protein [Lyngbya sp. CCY1209]|uniref:methyl-accepting chemotaxis protein n=1 Tax=Lyngbya sp. CCY1209 TaxID=2886103 RepID=UPI002D203581|nr:methyl-accepting chemotaxis protein [Lyngbya sp. CCY1209]MEB3886800.1 methyl-accepting chemotaxis protein [Lyngbya sp. CCY1209]